MGEDARAQADMLSVEVVVDSTALYPDRYELRLRLLDSSADALALRDALRGVDAQCGADALVLWGTRRGADAVVQQDDQRSVCALALLRAHAMY